MGTYFVSCKNNTAYKNSSIKRTKQNKIILAPNWIVLETKNQGLLKMKKLVN